jgi:hypothetical protein
VEVFIVLTPFEFGRAVKQAQELRFPDQPDDDPLGVGNSMQPGRYAGNMKLLGPQPPLSTLLQNNRNIPRQLQTKPKPKTLDIQPNKPIKVIDPNKQTT